MEAGVHILGRETELAAVEGLLHGAGEGFRALLLEGEAGIGKTTVFREALRMGEANGFRVLVSRPAASEATLSHAALGDLFHAVPAAKLENLPRPQRRALEVVLLLKEPDAGSLDQRAVAAGVHSLLRLLAAERPVLVAVDDVQWLDPASAVTLEFVLRRLGPEPVGLIATRRLPEPTRLDLEGLVPRNVLTRDRLGPLSRGAMQHLLRGQFGDVFPRWALGRIHGVSGGNPLFALEIGRALADGGASPATGEPLPVPADIRELIRNRVAALPEATRDLLLAAALLAEPSSDTLSSLGRSTEIDIEAAERAGVAAVEHGVVVFAHPLHAAAVIATSSERERRQMHRRLADVVLETEERARHLARAATRPAETTAKTLEEGAAAAAARGGLHSAAELLERARVLTPSNDAQSGQARGIRAADLHLHAGDLVRARSLLQELLREELAPAHRAEALRILAEIALADEDVLEAERLLVEALAITDDPRIAARIQTELAFILALRWELGRSAELCYQALAGLEGSDDGPLLAEALAGCAMAEFLVGRGADWTKLERALELEDLDRIALPALPPSGIAALITMFVGRHGPAREQLAATVTQLTERGDELNLAHALIWMSWLETRCGNLATAAEVVDEARACASLTGNDSFLRWAAVQRAWVDAHLGDVASARSTCAEFHDTRGIWQVGLWIAGTLGLVELSLGDPEAAWQACRPLTEMVEHVGIPEPVPLMFLPDALEALIELGQLGRAEALLETFERRGRELDRVWALATAGRCRGLLLAARGDLAGAITALDGALAEHKRIEMPFDRARALLARGVIERRTRQHKRARVALAEAAAEFERMSAVLWAKRARDQLDRVGGRAPREIGELTPAERRVVELAADGLSNKEIAAKLVVSVHTVEVHLSHAYAKLGVRSRSQLRARLAAAE